MTATDQLDLFDQLLTAGAAATKDATKPVVHVDPTHGHICVWDDQGVCLTAVDLGSVLNTWMVRGVDLTPSLAVDLGDALIRWGEGKMR